MSELTFGKPCCVSYYSIEQAKKGDRTRIYLGFDGKLHWCVCTEDEEKFIEGQAFRKMGWSYAAPLPEKKKMTHKELVEIMGHDFEYVGEDR